MLTTVCLFFGLCSPKPFVHLPWFLLLNTLPAMAWLPAAPVTLTQLIERNFDAQIGVHPARAVRSAARPNRTHPRPRFGTLLGRLRVCCT